MTDGKALLAAIRRHPAELTPRLAFRDWAKERPEAVGAMIEFAMGRVPRLALFGIGIGDGFLPGAHPREREEAFQESRRRLPLELDGFAAAMAWLAARRPVKGMTGTSEGWRLVAEGEWHETPWATRIENGSFIAAAVCSFFPWLFICRRHRWDVNVRVGISLARPGRGGRRKE